MFMFIIKPKKQKHQDNDVTHYLKASEVHVIKQWGYRI